MGCDIDAFIERSTKKFGPWEHHSTLNLDRNYRAFSAMAGVRALEEYECVAPLRGFPDDASAETESQWPERDEKGNRVIGWWCHSPGWLWAEEFEAALDRASQGLWGGVTPEYRDALQVMKALEADGSTSRIVFWFGD